MKSRAIIGIIVALLVIVASAGAIVVVKFPSLYSHTQPTPVPTQRYVVHRAEEIPFITQRGEATVATQQATQMLPWGIALDPTHGFVWVAEPGCQPTPKCPTTTQGFLSQYALSDGHAIQDFNEPTGYSSPLFAAVDKDGNVWFTQPSTDALGELDPQTGAWNTWPLQKNSAPFDLTFDAQGNLWFTEFGTADIGFFNPNTHTLVENPLPTPNSTPYGITIDPQGTIWFAENQTGINQIGSFKPTLSGTVKITEYPVQGLRPHLITADRAGNIWYSEGFSGLIGEFNPQSGTSTSTLVFSGICPPPCTGTHISGISVDSKGNIWFTDSLAQRVGYLIPSTGQVITQSLQTNNAHPYDGLIVDSSDRVWFTSEFALMLTMWPAGTVK